MAKWVTLGTNVTPHFHGYTVLSFLWSWPASFINQLKAVSQVIHSICVSWVWRAYISCRQKGTLWTRCDNSLFLHLHTLFDIKHHVYFQGVIHIAPSITRISPGWNPVSQQPLDLCVSHKGLVVLSFMCKLSDSLRNCSDFYWVQ